MTVFVNLNLIFLARINVLKLYAVYVLNDSLLIRSGNGYREGYVRVKSITCNCSGKGYYFVKLSDTTSRSQNYDLGSYTVVRSATNNLGVDFNDIILSTFRCVNESNGHINFAGGESFELLAVNGVVYCYVCATDGEHFISVTNLESVRGCSCNKAGFNTENGCVGNKLSRLVRLLNVSRNSDLIILRVGEEN